jgi:hypothetical protein
MTKFYAYDVCFPRGSFEREMRNAGLRFVCVRSLIRYNHREIWFSQHPDVDMYTEVWHTPVGNISRAFKNNPGRIMDPGADIQQEWYVKNREDFSPLIYFLQNALLTQETSIMENTLEEERDMGDDGIITVGVEFSPVVTAIHVLGLEAWSYAQYDCPKEYESFLNALRWYNELQYIAAQKLDKPRIIMASGITDNISPQIYRDSVLPCFERYGPTLRAKGMTLGVHAHAKWMSRYKEIVRDMGLGWVEAFTPPPYGDLTLAEARKCWGDDVFIW